LSRPLRKSPGGNAKHPGRRDMIRFFDLLLALLAILLLIPVFLLIGLMIITDSGGPVLFFQNRVGKAGKDFRLIKFRTMIGNSEEAGLLTVGKDDPRITCAGRFLRRYKLDELPQLFNVIRGEMSLVGPRPEMRKYTELYTGDQKKVLSIRPGLTDFASIAFLNENEILATSPDPEKTYIEEIMPVKLELNKKYLLDQSLAKYFSIILRTIIRVFR
jgi:lipopolysaccharide/colanic/teichoic acid biosynthesis glycosyltransferase